MPIWPQALRADFVYRNRGETYYGTLLSESMSTGPASAWDGTEADARYPDGEYEIWKAFTQYEDTDGFYFLQVWMGLFGNRRVEVDVLSAFNL